MAEYPENPGCREDLIFKIEAAERNFPINFESYFGSVNLPIQIGQITDILVPWQMDGTNFKDGSSLKNFTVKEIKRDFTIKEIKRNFTVSW